MPRKNQRNTRGKIVSAAWKLFYEQGYEDTTVEDIIFESETSKGTFYHYFEGKDALLETLSVLFDEKYQELMESMDESMDALAALEHLNWELFVMIDNSVPLELLSRLLSSQLITRGEKHLLDRKRVYFRLLRQIIIRGQERGELRRDKPCLCHVGARAYVRLVPVRRGILPVQVQCVSYAYVFERLSRRKSDG